MKSFITQQQIIAQARTWLGTKYHHQGRLKKSARGNGGVDCIGLVIGIIDELGIGIPLGEESEAYEVDILNGGTVVRTITVTSPTASYSAAEQTTDFGSAQSSIDIKIYQLSAVVGRGYDASATI